MIMAGLPGRFLVIQLASKMKHRCINFKYNNYGILSIVLYVALIFFTTPSLANNYKAFAAPQIQTDTTRFNFTGKVVDEKGESLPGATVFITNTKWAASTDADGTFKLTGIPRGSYEVLVRMMGFTTFTKVFTFTDRSINANLLLKTDAIALAEVKISAKPDPDRAKYLKIFTQNFIGESDNAKQSRILNPEVIRFNFDKRSGTLTASAVDLIRVKNEGLGYNLNYLLTSFTINERNRLFGYEGKLYFEELQGDEKQKNIWSKKRSTAYYGSARHFLKTIFAGTATAEGFEIYRIPDSDIREARVAYRSGVLRASNLATNFKPLNPDSLVKTLDENRKIVNLSVQIKDRDTARLYVCYMRNGEPSQFFNSIGHINIMFQNAQISRIYQVGSGNILLSSDGTVSPEKNLMVEGYWAWQHVADLLPYEVQNSFEMNTVVNTNEPLVEQGPVEKIHVQMDKPWYIAGDTAWMKVYVTDLYNKPIAGTKTCFVELIDANKRIIKNLRLPLNGGMAWGELALNDSLVKNRAYKLRVYTNSLQKNIDNVFYSNIRIINPSLARPKLGEAGSLQQRAAVVDSLKLQFFPEGGSLVADVNSRIALKASALGSPLNKVNGYIADKIGSHIAKFETDENGIGSFYLKPLTDGKYWAVLTLANGQEKRFALPQARLSGLAMSINQNDRDIVIYLNSNTANKTLYRLIAKISGQVIYQTQQTVSPGLDSMVIAKAELPQGIVQFSLYNTGKTLVAERFVHNLDKSRELNVKLMPGKKTYRPHEKIDLNIGVHDAEGRPVTGTFSVSVNNEADVSAGAFNGTTIGTDLFFTAKDRDVLHQLQQYDLTNPDAQQQLQIDHILLTLQPQKTKSAVSVQQPLLNAISDSTRTIEGQVYKANGKRAGEGIVNLFFTYGSDVLTTIADNEGRFVFNNIPAKRGSYFYVAAKDKSNKDLNVAIDKFVPPVIPDEIIADTTDFYANTDMNGIFKRLEDLQKENLLGTQLGEVTIIEKKKAEPTLKDMLLQKSSNLGARADQVRTFIDLLKCGGLDAGGCLALVLNNVQYYNDPDYNAKDTLHNKPAGLVNRFKKPIATFIDGVERSLNGMSYTEIALVEYISGASAAIYGMRSANGVVVITTKDGGIDYRAYEMEHYVPGSTKTPIIQRYRFENGFDLANEFYAPDYTQTQVKTIDKWRPTIYWNPNLITGADGKAQVSYFTNNVPGTYRVTIEGIDDQGRIARQVFKYTVNE